MTVLTMASNENKVNYLDLIRGSYFKGIADLVGMPGDITQIYNRYKRSPGYANLVAPEYSDSSPYVPTTQSIKDALDDNGYTNTPESTPQTFSQKLLADGVQGIGFSGPFSLAGDMMTGAKVLGNGMMNYAGNDILQKMFPDNTNPYIKYLMQVDNQSAPFSLGGASNG